MERYVVLVFTLLCIYVTFSYAEETKELTISVPHLESQPNTVRCPDGTHCPDLNTCCARGPGRKSGFDCCPYGYAAVCCPNFKSCCPARHVCTTVPPFVCIPLRYSSILRVQAIPLVNSTVKRCRDGTAGMAKKVSKSIPSQQAETASKISGFIGTSGNVFSPDGNYQCLHGTSICELSSGIYGCCHLVRGRRILKYILP